MLKKTILKIKVIVLIVGVLLLYGMVYSSPGWAHIPYQQQQIGNNNSFTPAAPSNLQIKIIDNTITLRWVDEAKNELGFTIFQNNAAIASVAANTTTYTVAQVNLNSQNCFMIMAFNIFGSSDPSNYICNFGDYNVGTFDLNNNSDLITQTSQDLQGRIAFVSLRDGNQEIYVIGANGQGIRRLTSNSEIDAFPEWSPDKQKIAYVWNPNGPYDFDSYEIYVMDADGSNQRQLTFNSAYDAWPNWSPNGQRIVFGSYRDGNGEIYIMNADGTNQTRLTYNYASECCPNWSPDGQHIVFESVRDGNTEIYVMDADGRNQINLSKNLSGDFYPKWSPDGRRIAFESNRDGNSEIYVMDANGLNQTNVTNHPYKDHIHATWSPDGKHIAFTRNLLGNDEIFITSDDGASQFQLTNNLASDFSPSWTSGNIYSISGRILVQENLLGNRNTTHVSRSLGYVVVTVMNHTKNIKSITTSSPSGDYAVNIDADVGDSLSIRADLIYRRNDTDFLQIQYTPAPGAPVVYIETQPFPASQQTFITQNLDFSSPVYYSPTGMNPVHLPDTALMYHHFQQALDFTFDILNVSLDYQLPIKVLAFDPSETSGRYFPQEATIRLSPSLSDSNHPFRPMNREWHEFFHHLMQDTIGIPDRAVGDVNHAGFINTDTADSWSEGWAEFWTMILADHLEPGRPPTYANLANLEQNIDVWTNLRQNNEGNWSSAEDFAVASLLWDLFDNENSNTDKDHVSMWATYLWWLLVRQNPDGTYQALDNMSDVYITLIARLPERKDDIDEIFKAHGFFGDRGWTIQDRQVISEGNKKFEDTEAVGYGGRENRLNAPYIDGSFLLVNLQNKDGQIVDSGTLEISIAFEPPYEIYNYSFEHPLYSGANNLVYLPVPWTNYTSTVTVAALNSKTLPYTTTNQAFWNIVLTSGQDYVAEKTFVIEPNKIYLPLILK